MAEMNIEKMAQNVSKKVIQELRNDGVFVGRWIPVKEGLPKEEEDCEYLVTTRNGLDILSFAKDLYKVDEYDFWDRKGVSGWFDYDSEYGYIETDGVIAWMPLPSCYKPQESEDEYDQQ